MSPEAMFNLHNGFLLLTCGLFSLIVPFGWAQQRNNKPDEFSCPEEFGYYPHPTDCTQYYVCVFGGALLESCTGGLMYSHDLQTCDWPRNVGCGASPASAANSLNTVSTASGSGPELGSRYTTPSWKHEIPQPQQDEIPDRHLYEEEDLGPVEEIESDRQQRVYRGQPPTLGQVARDRDGIVRHANALQTSAGPEKIKPVAVVSFGSHHQSLSKGNTTTQSTHVEQNEDDKHELNRVKRDLKNSTSDAKSRANDGYGIRYRPAQNGDPIPTDSTDVQTFHATTYRPPNISQNTHSSSNTHYTTITGSMRLIKLPTTKAPPIVQTAPNPYPSSGWPNVPVTPRPHQSNPLVAGSSRFNTYANSGNNLNDFEATDYSIVSVAPSIHPRPRFTTNTMFTTPSPSLALSYDHRDPNYHSTMYTQMPNSAAASHHHAVHNFPHNFRRNQVNNYYGSAGPPRFVPYPPPHPYPPYPYPYSPPETSIVTLSYPNSSPVFPNNQMTQYMTQPQPSTTESITLPPAISTSTTAAVQNATEKPQINSTKLQEGESKHHPNKNSKKGGRKPGKDNALSNTIFYPKDDFENEDEAEEQEYDEDKNAANEEEPEEEEHENEDFETYNFEDETEPAEKNQSAKYSAKKPAPVQENTKKPPDENENEEAELEYIFEEEEQDAGDDEPEKIEKEKEEDDDEADEKGEEKGDEKDEEENAVKPVSNFYKRYITDELDNPFAKPDFDFNSYLSDLAKPIEVPGEETRKKVKKSKKPATNQTQVEGDNAGTNVHQNMSRKHDRIVRLHLYDEQPEANMKLTRATKPGQAPKRVVPMALVHSYKPANYSYPTRYHLHSPSNYNYKTLDNFKYDKTNDYKPFTFGTNYNFTYPKYENPSPLNQQNQNVTDYSDEACTDENPCNNEDEEYANAEEGEEEEDAPAGNDENASVQDNEEYYDDYAQDYSNEHLPPKTPAIPDKLKNIDKEVTSPPVRFDDTEEQSEGNQEDENASNQGEEESGNENEEPEQANEEEQEYDDDSQQPNTDAEETVLSSQQYKTPLKHSSHYTDKGTVSVVDQVMIPHRQNKFLKNYTTELTNHISTSVTKPSSSYKPKNTFNALPTTHPLTTNSYHMTTYRTPLMRNTLTTPHYNKFKQNFDYKEKTKPSLHVNKTRTTDYYKFQPPVNPTSSYTATSNVVTHPLPTRKTEQRYGNKTKAIYHKFPNEDNGKNDKHRETNRAQPTQKPTTVHWPPPSVPPYIIEQHSVPSVPTTPKSVYNLTKFEPYYNVYDDEAEIYRDIDYGQYNQRKQQDSYQVIQEPHRLQPIQPQSQPSQILTNPPSYNNQDYKLQSDIDGDTQQSEKLPSTRGRNRGSVTYTTGGNEYEATPAGGRTRPTLKPSTSIVSKASESIDIYRFAPKRPDTVYPTPQVDKVAAKCRKDICLLPDCSCGGKDIPGDLRVEDTPQLVLLTFDDSVNELNRGLYTDLFEKGRTNPNGCPISATFYVSHEWTDYSMVQNLYAAGHEIASHSVSHSFGEQFSQRKWTKEIVGQREILSAYGGVKQEDIRGMRAPFLAVGGNKMFKMLYDANFTYDSSMPIYENRPPSWPYTLDYKIFHDCMIPPCPTRSYPGVWEVPMVMWQDLNGGRCSMGDACSNPPDSDGVYKMLIKNFERHFTTNRAPFGLFYHSSWFTQPHHKEGFIAFLDTIVNMPEVWLVTNWQAIQWARDPTPISRLNNFTPFNCDYPDRPRRCNNAKVCNLWHKSGVRYLKTCQPCPDVYPWTGKTGVRNSRVDNDDTLVE